MKWGVIFLILAMVIPISIADYSDCNVYGTCTTPKTSITFNNNTGNVNNTLYWQGHTGTDGSWLTGIPTLSSLNSTFLNLSGTNANQDINIGFNGLVFNKNGARLYNSEAKTGKLGMSGIGNTFNEDLVWAFEKQNQVEVTSTTGVTQVNFTGIGLSSTTLMEAVNFYSNGLSSYRNTIAPMTIKNTAQGQDLRLGYNNGYGNCDVRFTEQTPGVFGNYVMDFTGDGACAGIINALKFDIYSGTKIGSASNERLSFWGQTPVVQPSETTAIDTLLTNTGLRGVPALGVGIANFDTNVTAPAFRGNGTKLTGVCLSNGSSCQSVSGMSYTNLALTNKTREDFKGGVNATNFTIGDKAVISSSGAFDNDFFGIGGTSTINNFLMTQSNSISVNWAYFPMIRAYGGSPILMESGVNIVDSEAIMGGPILNFLDETTGALGGTIQSVAGSGTLSFLNSLEYIFDNKITAPSINITTDANIVGNLNILGNLSVKRPYFSGYDNSTQNFQNTANVQVINITNNAKYDAWLINVTDKQNLTFKQAGDYQCTLSPEFFQNGGGSVVTFWMQQNGTDVTWSNSRYSMSNNEYHAPSIIFHFDINNPATENVRFMWWSDSTSTQIYSSGALTLPTRPSIPGVLVTCLKVSEVTPQ